MIAQVVDGEGVQQPADARLLDVDDARGVHFQRLACVARRFDAFIKANRRAELGLEDMMIPQIILGKRLFNQEQVEIIQRFERIGGFKRVGAVGVNLQCDFGKGAAHCSDELHVVAGLDFEFDAAVALLNKVFNPREEGIGAFLQANRNADRHGLRSAAQHGLERSASALAQQIPERHFQTGLCHLVAAHRRDAPLEVRGGILIL